jgi:hypothetical protein
VLLCRVSGLFELYSSVASAGPDGGSSLILPTANVFGSRQVAYSSPILA